MSVRPHECRADCTARRLTHPCGCVTHFCVYAWGSVAEQRCPIHEDAAHPVTERGPNQ